MDFFSLLLNVGLLAYVAHLTRKNGRAQPAQTVSLPVPAASPNPREKRLDIEGAITIPPALRNFVRGFGIRNDQLIDLACYASPGNIDSFPEDVRGCLTGQYREGLAFGVEAMQLVCLNGTLQPGQALYFALISTGQQSLPQIVAFVDKVRPVGVTASA